MVETVLDKFDKIDLMEKSNKIVVTGLAAVGAYYLGSMAYQALKGFTKYCLLPRRDLKGRYGGGWALVTGASDGIGKAYAHELAKSGFDVILMARNQEKLDAVAKEIETEFKVKTKVVIFDFSTLTDETSATKLKEELEKLKYLDISVLVNNVGNAKFAKLHEQSIQDCLRQVSINVYAQTFMTNFLLPRLLERQNRSAIIDVSSVCVYQPMGSLPMYCATKCFNLSLSKCIAEAYRDKIDVLCVTPHSVKS